MATTPAALNDAVQWLHNFPRVEGTNQFPTSFDAGNPQTLAYLTGVAGAMVGFIALGVIIAIIMTLLYMLASCNCCCFGRWAKQAPGMCARVVLVVAVILGVATCGIAFAATAPANSMGSAVGELVTGLQQLSTTVSMQGTAAASAGTAASTLQTSATTLADSLDSYTPPIPSSSVRSLATAAGVAASGSTGSGSQLNTLVQPLSSVDSIIAPQEEIVKTFPLAEAAVFGVFVILFLITLLPLSVCKCFHKIMSPVMIVFIVLIWVAVGVLLAVALVSADLCADIDNTLVKLVENGGDSLSSVKPSVEYYLKCDETPAMSVNGTFLALAQDGLQSLQDANASVAMMDSLKQYPQMSTADKASIDQVQANYAALITSVEGVVDSVRCPSFSVPLNTMIGAVCSTFVADGFAPFWTLQAVCAVLLALILILNLQFCIRHTSEAGTPSTAGEETVMNNAVVGSKQSVTP